MLESFICYTFLYFVWCSQCWSLLIEKSIKVKAQFQDYFFVSKVFTTKRQKFNFVLNLFTFSVQSLFSHFLFVLQHLRCPLAERLFSNFLSAKSTFYQRVEFAHIAINVDFIETNEPKLVFRFESKVN